MKQFDYEKIMQPKTVIHCPTENQANELLKWADSKGLDWSCGNYSYLHENNWDKYQEKTHYYLYEGKFGTIKSYNKNRGFTILSFKDVLLQDKKLCTLENGKDLIRKADGSLRIIEGEETEKLAFIKVNTYYYRVTKYGDAIELGEIQFNFKYNKYYFYSIERILSSENLDQILTFLKELNNEKS